MPTPKWAKDGIEQAKDFAVGVNDKLDATADNAIDAMKAKTGKFTWVVIAGVILGILVAFGLLLAFSLR